MRDAFRLLITDRQGRLLPPGARATAFLLGYVLAAGIAGALLLYAISMRAQGPLPLSGLSRALVPLIPAILLVLEVLPAIAAARRLWRWRLALAAGLALPVTAIISFSLIAALHDDCVKIPGCTHRAAVIYLVSFDQFLYLSALFAVLAAAVVAFSRAIWLSVREPE